jgi:8-oxo-dGTP diphosphatase
MGEFGEGEIVSAVPTRSQVSAGGVAFRIQAGIIEVVLISVGPEARWQLPKGLVGKNETPELAASREVREEGGVETELLDLIDTVEYWYYSSGGGKRIRFHKHVHFYLMRYLSGDVREHDAEVNEAAWVQIDQAVDLLAFKSEKQVVEKARGMIRELEQNI